MKSCLLAVLLIVSVSQCHASAVEITTKNVPNGIAKTHYSAVIAATGGCTPYQWAVVSGKLPPGVEEKASTTTTSLDLSGTPTIAASYPFTVSVKDCGGHVAEASYKIVIKAAIDITTKNVPNGTAKTYYSAVIAATGGCTPYQWAVSGKLPPGVEEKASTTTTSLDLSGTPTIAASYPFTVSVKDCGGHVADASYKIVIKAATSYVVDLKWDASTSNDVAGYNVYRGPDGVRWEKINDSLVPSTYYNDSTVTDGSTYYYSATAVSVSGEESKKTSAIKVSIPE